MKRLWARIGMNVDVTDEEYDVIKILLDGGLEDEARKILWELFKTRAYMNGDSYMPGNHCDAAVDNPNEDEFILTEEYK
jgi:hypothetical protein